MTNFKLPNNQGEIEFQTLVDNIEAVFNATGKMDVLNGSSWYYTANRYATIIGSETGVSVFVVSLVIAALSPQNRWENSLKAGNLGDALRLIENFLAGNDITSFKVATYDQNKTKAWNILSDWNDGHVEPDYFYVKYFVKSPKTWNFSNNITFPHSQDYVTIDGHSFNIARHGLERHTIEYSKNISLNAANRYTTIVRAYRVVADKLGIMAWQLQAITWEYYRNLDVA